MRKKMQDENAPETIESDLTAAKEIPPERVVKVAAK